MSTYLTIVTRSVARNEYSDRRWAAEWPEWSTLQVSLADKPPDYTHRHAARLAPRQPKHNQSRRIPPAPRRDRHELPAPRSKRHRIRIPSPW